MIPCIVRVGTTRPGSPNIVAEVSSRVVDVRREAWHVAREWVSTEPYSRVRIHCGVVAKRTRWRETGIESL